MKGFIVIKGFLMKGFDTKIKKRIGLSIYYFITSISLELFFFYYINTPIPKYFIMDIIIISIISLLLFIIPYYQVQLRIIFLFLLLQINISYVNYTLYDIFGDFFSTKMLLVGIIEGIFDFSLFNYSYLTCLLLILVITIYFINKITNQKLSSEKNLIILPSIIAFFIISILSYSYNHISNHLDKSQNQNTTYKIGDDKNLYDTLYIKVSAIKRFGSFPYYFKEIRNYYFTENTIDLEKTKNFFKNSPMNEKNAYTGILKNDNVIIILLESVEWFVINSELTPTLYKLSQDGFRFKQYYSKNRTNYSETIGILGSYPRKEELFLYTGWLNNYSNTSFPFSLPNMLKNDGVEITTYLHGNTKDNYTREFLMPKLGFDKSIYIENMDLNDQNDIEVSWVLDSSVIKHNIDHIVPKTGKRFLTYYTTITSHGPYRGNHRLAPYYQILNDLPEDKKIRDPFLFNFQAAVMDIDRGIEYLLNHLEQAGLMDNTTIVLYSDHQAFYNKLSYNVKGINKNDISNTEIYRVPMFIYSKKLGKGVNTDFVSVHHIVPTLLDLLGINYQTNFYQATSVFADKKTKGVVVSKVGGMFNDIIYTEDAEDFVSIHGNPLEESELAEFRSSLMAFFNGQAELDKIYEFDIFNPQKDLSQ